MKFFKGKTVLIIGGTGTLGDETIKQLLQTEARTIRTLSRNEHKVFLLKQKYAKHEKRLRFLLGDIRDKNRIDLAMTGVDIVINFAAIKHVFFANTNPFETLNTNVIGVQNALECAVKHNIETFVQMSTDKAVSPTCFYGCSKAMAEHLVLQAKEWQGYGKTKFVVIRSGNVLESTGSVLEIWKSQKEQGIPLTVTDMNAVRYAAPREKIVSAILDTVYKGINGLVVLSMPKYKVKDLLTQFQPCETQIIGLQDGEKISEVLYREGEKFTEVVV